MERLRKHRIGNSRLHWRMLKVSDVCNITSSRRIFRREYVEDGVPFYRSKEIILKSKSQVIVDTLYISRKRYKEIKTKYGVPAAGDILLTSVGTLGNPYLVQAGEEFYFKDGNLTWFKDYNGKVHSRFLYYWLLSPTAQGQINSIKIGSSQPAVTIDSLKGMTIAVPSDDVQTKIVQILSAYDDLIENNNRRIKLLEQIAQTIYDEWFVKFRFPGHSKVKMVSSEMGKIPEGWEIKQIKELAEILRGKSYRGKDLTIGDGKPFLNLKNIQRYGGYRVDGLKWYVGPYKESQVAKPGDIVIAITDMTQERMIVARAARVPIFEFEKYVFSMDLVKIQPKNAKDKEFLLGAFFYSSFGDEVKQYANGVNVLHLSPDRIAEYKLIVPSEALRQRYSDICGNTFALIDTLRAKNRNLSQTRDILLPKLISGEIDVEDMDIEIGDVDDR